MQPTPTQEPTPERYLRLGWRERNGGKFTAKLNSLTVYFNGNAVIWTSGDSVVEIEVKDLFEAESAIKEFYEDLLVKKQEAIKECEKAISTLFYNLQAPVKISLGKLQGQIKNCRNLIARFI